MKQNLMELDSSDEDFPEVNNQVIESDSNNTSDTDSEEPEYSETPVEPIPEPVVITEKDRYKMFKQDAMINIGINSGEVDYFEM